MVSFSVAAGVWARMTWQEAVSSVPAVVALTLVCGGFQCAVMDVMVQAKLIGILVGGQLVLTGVFKALPGPFKAKPLLAAFEFTTTIFCMWMSYRGLMLCIDNLFSSDFAAEDVEERMYGSNPTAGYNNNVLAAFVFFELAMLIVLPEMRTWDAVLHHVAVCIVCSFTFWPRPFAMFYAPYYSGMQELSSVPLGLVDIFKQFPSTQSDYP